MAKLSAGVLLFKYRAKLLEVLLVHPGGPFWRNKDAGAWSIPKGEYTGSEDPLEAARREFQEETGFPASGPFLPLGQIKQPGGKLITAFACEGELSPAEIRSNTFRMEWPPKSGRQQEFPEIDRAAWFTVEEAQQRVLKGQSEFIERLVAQLR